MNDAKLIKKLLDTLVLPSQRDFAVALMERPKGVPLEVLAQYAVGGKTIMVYDYIATRPNRALALAVHELAHHLRRTSTGRRGHDRHFVATLDNLVRVFNLQFSSRLKATLCFDKRRPATEPPFWVRNEKTEHHGNIRVKGVKAHGQRKGGDKHGSTRSHPRHRKD